MVLQFPKINKMILFLGPFDFFLDSGEHLSKIE